MRLSRLTSAEPHKAAAPNCMTARAAETGWSASSTSVVSARRVSLVLAAAGARFLARGRGPLWGHGWHRAKTYLPDRRRPKPNSLEKKSKTRTETFGSSVSRDLSAGRARLPDQARWNGTPAKDGPGVGQRGPGTRCRGSNPSTPREEQAGDGARQRTRDASTARPRESERRHGIGEAMIDVLPFVEGRDEEAGESEAGDCGGAAHRCAPNTQAKLAPRPRTTTSPTTPMIAMLP